MSTRLPLVLVLVLSVQPAMAIETPDYRVLSSEGEFEIRDYPPLTTVRTSMGEGDFMRLFRFISGSNETKTKIAMTAPVLTQSAGEKAGMSFVVPREVAAGAVPQPEEEGVVLDVLPPARFAVLRFSGWRTRANEDKALQSLRAWLADKSLEATGEPVFAYYDPPWTLPFLRRNEVMLKLAGAQP